MDEHPHAATWRRAAAAFNASGDLGPFVDRLAPRCVWHGLGGAPDADGRDGVRAWWEAAREAGWDRHDVLVAGATEDLGVVLARNHGAEGWREAATIAVYDGERIAEAWYLLGPDVTARPPELSRRVVDAWLDGAGTFNDLGDLSPLFGLVAEDCVQHLLSRGAESRGRSTMRTAWEAARRTTGWTRTEHLVIGGTDRLMASLYRTRRDEGWRTSAWIIELRGGLAAEMWTVDGSTVPAPAR